VNIYKVLGVAVVSAMLSAGCAESKEAKQEGRTVYEQIQQRDELHDARFEILKGLEDEELGRALYGQEMSNFQWMMDVFVFYAGRNHRSVLAKYGSGKQLETPLLHAIFKRTGFYSEAWL